MQSADFASILDSQIDICKDVLVDKAREYADGVDRLHNFKQAAHLQGVSMRQALAGMMAKHTVSIYDMCADENSHTAGEWTEKITDHINYLLLLKAVIIEETSDSAEVFSMFEF